MGPKLRVLYGFRAKIPWLLIPENGAVYLAPRGRRDSGFENQHQTSRAIVFARTLKDEDLLWHGCDCVRGSVIVEAMGSWMKIQHIIEGGMVGNGIGQAQMVIIGLCMDGYAIASVGAL